MPEPMVAAPDVVYQINPASCIECGQCRRFCPLPGAVILNEQYQHTIVADACSGCGLCEAFCPVPGTLVQMARGDLTDVFSQVEAQTLHSLGHNPARGRHLRVLRRLLWRRHWHLHAHPLMCDLTATAHRRWRLLNQSRRLRHVQAVKRYSARVTASNISPIMS